MPPASRQSAGILLYRRVHGRLEVLLVHPGGPFWAKKDLGAWTIPKGEYTEDESPEQAARREFAEETGVTLESSDELLPLGEVKQKSGKLVRAFAVQMDFDPNELRSNTFELEWPPRSGRRIEVPEVDRAEWFDLDEASRRIIEAQRPFLERLREAI
jgi:predicted NUDIX family NTP pyrophosphohydrolase